MRSFSSVNAVEVQQHDYDPRVRPHCHTAAEMMQPPSDAVPTLVTPPLLLLGLFHKIPSLAMVDLGKPYLTKNKITGTEYAVSISRGR